MGFGGTDGRSKLLCLYEKVDARFRVITTTRRRRRRRPANLIHNKIYKSRDCVTLNPTGEFRLSLSLSFFVVGRESILEMMMACHIRPTGGGGGGG